MHTRRSLCVLPRCTCPATVVGGDACACVAPLRRWNEKRLARQLILASASPRRRELLDLLGVSFDTVPADVDETVSGDVRWVEAVPRQLALRKAWAIAERYPEAVVLAADTVVVLRRRILGKPESADDARRMLRSLRGGWHDVITGVSVASAGTIHTEAVRTRVKLRSYSLREIEASIERGDVFDKAGGYGIQDARFNPVEACAGCYCNVVGLPLGTVLPLLRDAGVAVGDEAGISTPAQCATCPLFSAA